MTLLLHLVGCLLMASHGKEQRFLDKESQAKFGGVTCHQKTSPMMEVSHHQCWCLVVWRSVPPQGGGFLVVMKNILAMQGIPCQKIHLHVTPGQSLADTWSCCLGDETRKLSSVFSFYIHAVDKHHAEQLFSALMHQAPPSWAKISGNFDDTDKYM